MATRRKTGTRKGTDVVRRPERGARKASLDEALQEQLKRAFRGRTWQRRDAKAFVELLYADDAFATSEGSPQSWTGPQQLLALATDVMERFRIIHFRKVRTSALGPGGASQIVTVRAVPRTPKSKTQTFKVLYTWRKTRAGWRIVHDVTAHGGVDESP